MRASLRLMARPRPVPPNFRAVNESACVNSANSFACCSGVMPMPVSDTASSIQWPPFTTLRALSLTSPCLVKRLPVLSRSFRLPGILARFLRLQLQHVYAEQRRWQAALLQLAGQLYSEAHG